jgi:leucyl aminopeptidase
MSPVTLRCPIASVSDAFAAVEVDLLVIPWFEGETPDLVPGLDAATAGELTRAIVTREFQAKRFELFFTPIGDRAWRARRLAAIGAGARADSSTDLLRRLAMAAGIAARQKHSASVGFVLRGDGDIGDLTQAVAEGLTLSEFDGGTYKTADPPPAAPPAWTVVAGRESREQNDRIATRIARGRVLAESSNLARGLANEPGNALTPREFARRASMIASEAGVQVDVLDETRIAELGMGLLLGVARGSSEPPRLMVFRYDPPGAPPSPVLGLVGKGITFDTGGISIKPADGMERMKDDMAGGAAVACAMRAIALLQAPIRVVGVVPATENMPGGRAIKPGDILTSAAGKTVEVINTDAEGRLILGDGLWYARQLGATHLVDVATLTGAIVVALGKLTSGLFGTPRSWVEHVRRVADAAGDRVWPMPDSDEYFEQLKSEIADFTNTGGRPAGAITASLFLKQFAGDLPWAHIDIAGTAWAEEAKPYMPKGATGVAVRTLAELAFQPLPWA